LLVALLAATSLLSGRLALAHHTPLPCRAPNPVPIAPNAVHGVVSRVQINPKIGPGIVYTIQPNLAGLDLVTWMRNLEQVGVNIAELYLQPEDRLSPVKLISQNDWDAYIAAALLPYRAMTPAQQSAYLGARNAIAARNGMQGITTDQQAHMILAFLRRLEEFKQNGQICGNVQFVVVERRWFPTSERLGRQFASEAVYARTLADLVNQTVAAGLGHWLAGFLLTEYTNTDMNRVLPIAIDLAKRINSLTSNWLMSHLMILAGGGFGDQFNGIDQVVCPAGAGRIDSGYQFRCRPGGPLDFFGFIASQTGTFAFAYKFFNWKKAPSPFSYCATFVAGCHPWMLTASQWIQYLDDHGGGLGFRDLATFVNENAARYPHDANVIFIGDATDSMYKMTMVGRGLGGDVLMPLPSLTALVSLFRNAARDGGGWSGRIFMDAYGDENRLSDAAHLPVDNGSYLFYVDYSPFDFSGSGRVSANPQSQAYWRAWPSLPARRQ
jgi:hypothetical protein